MADSNRSNTGGVEEFSSMQSSSSSDRAMEKGKEIASDIGERAGEMAGRAEQGAQKVGEKLGSLASNIRDRAPQSGRMGTAASAVADSLEAGGQYLREHNLSDIGGEIGDIVKRYPMATLWVGLGVGFVLGQALVRR